MWIYILRTASAEIFDDLKISSQVIAHIIGCFVALLCAIVWVSSVFIVLTGAPASIPYLNMYPGTVSIVIPIVAFCIRLGIVMRKIRRSMR